MRYNEIFVIMTNLDPDIIQQAFLNAWTISDLQPYYKTKLGSAYLGDSEKLLEQIETESVDLIFTSPPYALNREKDYGNVSSDEYIKWFQF